MPSSPASCLLALVVAAGLSACATADPGAPAAEAKPPVEYRTGSNIPLRATVPAATVDERERAAEQVKALQRTGTSGPPGAPLR